MSKLSRPVLQFRNDFDIFISHEKAEASEYFHTCFSRCDPILKNRVVIGRYSNLPYYAEWVRDIKLIGGVPLQNLCQHKHIADFLYYTNLKEYTPLTKNISGIYNPTADFLPPYVLKGVTNSLKRQFDKKMYAETKEDAVRIYHHLKDDTYIGSQDILVRKYIPLETFEIGINGQRFTNEVRCFYLGEHRVAHGPYWVNASPKTIKKVRNQDLSEMFEIADEIANIASTGANFYVLDMAKTEEGKWILIEMNDGQMSGLQGVDVKEFYKNLAEIYDNHFSAESYL